MASHFNAFRGTPGPAQGEEYPGEARLASRTFPPLDHLNLVPCLSQVVGCRHADHARAQNQHPHTSFLRSNFPRPALRRGACPTEVAVKYGLGVRGVRGQDRQSRIDEGRKRQKRPALSKVLRVATKKAAARTR